MVLKKIIMCAVVLISGFVYTDIKAADATLNQPVPVSLLAQKEAVVQATA